MTDRPFKQATAEQQRKAWQKIHKLRKTAANNGNYAAADFMELLEKLITGEHLNKTADKLSQLQIAFNVDTVNFIIHQ